MCATVSSCLSAAITRFDNEAPGSQSSARLAMAAGDLNFTKMISILKISAGIYRARVIYDVSFFLVLKSTSAGYNRERVYLVLIR